ncbi:hypothetical protein DK842_07460 [Chromobacterium phragmitis]|nr:hypothetical protein DK842_07460 [Chromobacterium phragmitis]
MDKHRSFDSLILCSFYLSISRLLGSKMAHLKVRDHDKAFYQLCQHMLPNYHQLEFDLRLWLNWREHHAD